MFFFASQGRRAPGGVRSMRAGIAPAETSRGPDGLPRISFRTWDVSTLFAEEVGGRERLLTDIRLKI
jgi:hypothetical protein